MRYLRLFRSKHVLCGVMLPVLLVFFSWQQLNGSSAGDNLDAVKLVEKARELRAGLKLEEALVHLHDAVKLAEDNGLKSLALLETAYIKYLQGKSPIVYNIYIKEAFKLNPRLIVQEYYDKGFKRELERFKPSPPTARTDPVKEKEMVAPAETAAVPFDDLKIYERKSLFIFPVVYKSGTGAGKISSKRKQFLTWLLYKMFVKDFKRNNFFEVQASDSADEFLQDAHSFVRKNVKRITVKRLKPDGKLKEAIVTAGDLVKTTTNSYALVPYFDSVERKEVEVEDDEGNKSKDYVYNIYVHFDIYNTRSKEKIKTLKINNKKNLLGKLASVTGSLQVDNSDLEGLSEDRKKDEESFRNSIAGLYSILKKKMKEMPQFRIFATLSMVSHKKFGFELGRDTGIKTDHRYMTYVNKADGGRKMTGFGKIRKVVDAYSEAQTLIGRPEEGDQVMEDPKIGINVTGGLGMVPIHINLGDDVSVGSHLCLFLGAEYELGPVLKLSELYTALNLRIGFPSTEEDYSELSVSQVLFNFGVVKKFYFRRLALNLGGFIGVHSSSLKLDTSKSSSSQFGITLNTAVEYMLTPSISAFGGFTLDVYPNPSKYKVDGSEYVMPEDWEWKAVGLSLNLGAKMTF